MTEPMEADKTAQFLMKMTAPENEYDRLTHELYTLVRKAGTPLMIIMTQLNELATARTNEMEIGNAEEEIERLMYVGFEKFTTGIVRQEFLETYEYRKREAKGQPKWTRMLELLVERERRLGLPSIDLKFCERGSPVEGASAYHIVNYNVNTKQINKVVTTYKPTIAHTNRKDQYSTQKEGKSPYEIQQIEHREIERLALAPPNPPAEGLEAEIAYESASDGESSHDFEEITPLRRSAR
jgi:hypothetical protein